MRLIFLEILLGNTMYHSETLLKELLKLVRKIANDLGMHYVSLDEHTALASVISVMVIMYKLL